MRRLVGVALALALVAGACDGTNTAAEPTTTVEVAAPLTESQWLGRYALWVTDVRVALLHTDRAALERCSETLEAELGDVPRPLRKAKRLLARACGRFARGARSRDRERAFVHWSQGALLVRDANSRLPHRQAMERLPLPVFRGLTQASRVEPFFTRVANDIAAPANEVRCWSRADWKRLQREEFGKDLNLAGFASPAFKRVNLAWDMCDALGTLAYTHLRPGGIEQLDIAFAVTTLMHEAGHLNESGDFFGAGQNEPLAECWGMQHVRQAARALGASRAYADSLAERYWAEVYPTRPADYRTRKCRDGGAYDVDKESSVWP